MDYKQTAIFLIIILCSFIFFISGNIGIGFILLILGFVIGSIFKTINNIRRTEISNKVYKEMKEEQTKNKN